LEDSIKTLIKKYRFDFAKSIFEEKQKDQTEPGFGKLEMPLFKDVKNSRFLPSSQNIAVAGLVRLNSDDVIRNSNEMNWLKCL
jgi:hypothetical protein